MEDAMVWQSNRVLLRGTVVEEPVFSHENHGREFWRLGLSVQRLSGAFDHLNILAEESRLAQLDPSQGPMLEVEGQIRTYHNPTGQGRRLVISVLAGRLCHCQGPFENQVFLRGTLCREPVYRHTPLGREITDVMLAVERSYHRVDNIPCILWGSVARMGAQCPRGSGLSVQGRLQSREYVKRTETGSEARTAYEVSAITAQRD